MFFLPVATIMLPAIAIVFIVAPTPSLGDSEHRLSLDSADCDGQQPGENSKIFVMLVGRKTLVPEGSYGKVDYEVFGQWFRIYPVIKRGLTDEINMDGYRPFDVTYTTHVCFYKTKSAASGAKDDDMWLIKKFFLRYTGQEIHYTKNTGDGGCQNGWFHNGDTLCLALQADGKSYEQIWGPEGANFGAPSNAFIAKRPHAHDWLAVTTSNCSDAQILSRIPVHFKLYGRGNGGEKLVGGWKRIQTAEPDERQQGKMDKYTLQAYSSDSKLQTAQVTAFCFWRKGDPDDEDEKGWKVANFHLKWSYNDVNLNMNTDCDYGWMHNKHVYCVQEAASGTGWTHAQRDDLEGPTEDEQKHDDPMVDYYEYE